MRFHSTIAFSEKLKAARVAQDEFEAAFDGAPDNDTTRGKLKAQMASVIDCLQHPAVTPTELRLKLSLYRDNNVGLWSDRPTALDAFEAIINDTTTLQSYYPGPEMFQALADWRKAEEIYQFAPDLESDEGNQICEARSAAFRALISMPCTTAGDFIAKTYVNLLGVLGNTWFGDNREAGWGNIFDINTANEDDERDDTCAFHRAAYFDIDHSDIGANLLAYGQPHFSAELWMERADAIGLRVGLVNVEGSRTLWQSMDTDAEHDSPAGREVDRLRRILAFDADLRTVDLIDEIERGWPQLISGSVGAGGASA